MRAGTALDWMDFKILAKLQREGRASNVEVADAVGLSPSPCLARIKRLQKIGIITGYGANLSLAMLGKYITIFVEITIDRHHRRHLQRFEDVAEQMAEVLECYNVSGGYDYLVKIIARDTDHFQTVMEGLLGSDGGIKRFKSYIVLRQPFRKTEYPLRLLFEE